VFNSQKNDCQLQVANAKLEAADIGYQAGYSKGQLELNKAIINNLLQYGALQVGMPCDENGIINASGTYAKNIILIPYNEKETQEK
jgi:hypothetical protein